jgi:DNA-binding transcriptional LysR family regulator
MGFTGSASFTPLVRHAIRRYRQRWPGVILALEEMNTIRLLDKLRRGALDAAFIRPGVEDPEGIRLIRAPDEEMRVALPASHPLAAHPQIPLTALEGEPLVLFPRAAGLSLYDEISAAFLACGIDPVVDQEVPQMSSVVTLRQIWAFLSSPSQSLKSASPMSPFGLLRGVRQKRGLRWRFAMVLFRRWWKV